MKFLLLLLLILPAICHAAPPDRIVSLNLCADQYLVLLAPEKIAALTPLSRDPTLSYVAPKAADLPVIRPSAEAILRLHPGLVMAAEFGATSTVTALQAANIPILRINLPADFNGIRTETRRLATILGVPDRGTALIARMDATLAAIPRPSTVRTAIPWQPRGYTSGPNSLMAAVLRAAGLNDLATGARLETEALVRNPPDLLVLPQPGRFPSLATAMLSDPAVRDIPRIFIPPALTICPGPFTAQAVALLAK